jgi:tRNA A-37 threonylcarbamoyl transferase component Bud32
VSSTVLSSRYRLDKLIGGGGMGEVWQAHDEVLDRDVAVKVIRSHLADSETVRARLRVEARLTGQLHHPGIVDVFDYGEHQTEERAVPFVVMPLIDGQPLSRVLQAAGRLTPGETMAVVAQVADALHASHLAGIIHRDLKPGNILIARNGRTMLVDFGIARAADGEPLTETGALLGTANYLSPEHCAGRPATPESDLYGLGVVAYACLTGTLPFHRGSDIATALAHIQDPLPPMDQDIPVAVRDLVTRLLEKDPADRPTDAHEVAVAARALATQLPSIAAVTEPAPLAPVAETPSRGTAAMSAPAAARRPARRTVTMGLAAVTALAAAVTVIGTRGPGDVKVPSVKGDSVSAASAELVDEQLRVRTKDIDAANRDVGDVVRQVPAAGTTVEQDSAVTIWVATGRVRVPKDDLLGATYARAAARLTTLGLKARRIDTTSSKPAGTVIAVGSAGRAISGSTIELTVAKAPVVITPTSVSGGATQSAGPSKGSPKAKPKGKAPKPRKHKRK